MAFGVYIHGSHCLHFAVVANKFDVVSEEPKVKPKRKSRTNWLVMLANVAVIAGLLISYLSAHIPPKSFGYFSLAGLAFPHLLLLNLGFIVYWLFKKRKYALFSLLAILTGFNHLTDIYVVRFNTPQKKNETHQLKVLTYNVRLFNIYLWNRDPELRERIFTQLKTIDADVICFQEFFHSEREDVYAIRDSLLELLPTKFYHERYTHATNGRDFFGVAIFSKYPIVNRGLIPFETDVNNFCIYTDIRVNDDTVRVYDAHLASIRLQYEDYKLLDQNAGNEDFEKGSKRIAGRLYKGFQRRQPQTEKIIRDIESSPHPVVLCGDFNDTPISYCYESFTDVLDDSFREAGSGVGNTYVGFQDFALNLLPCFRIDYILHSRGMRAISYKTHEEEFSDHHGVSATLVW